MTATASNNRPQRKQLSDQIDRLDSILDGLGGALNGAVAEAAREGMRLALKDALIEIMVDAGLRAKLHQATAPEQPERQPSTSPGILEHAASLLGRLAKACQRTAANLVERGRAQVKTLTHAAAEGLSVVRTLGSLKNLALVGVGVGVTVGVVGLVAPHAVAAGLSGLCGGMAAVAVQLGVWTRRALATLSAT
jgi:hypothetical protein